MLLQCCIIKLGPAQRVPYSHCDNEFFMMESEYVGKLSIKEQAEAPKIVSVLRLDSNCVPETKSILLLIPVYVSKIMP